jgi:thiamine biosynthesis protein ThiS
MQISVNGESREIPDDLSAATLLEQLGLTGKRLAMEVNQEILPRGRFEQHRFHPGDRVEIVQAIGGG